MMGGDVGSFENPKPTPKSIKPNLIGWAPGWIYSAQMDRYKVKIGKLDKFADDGGNLL